MGTITDNISTLSGVTAATLEFAKIVSKPLQDMIGCVFIDGGNRGRNGVATWPAEVLMKNILSPWRNHTYQNVTVPQKEISKLFTVFLEQQQQYYRLTKALFDCNTEMMRALHIDAPKGNDAAKILKTCQEAMSQYGKTCQEFLDSQWSQGLKTMNIPGISAEATGKIEPVKK